MNLVPYTATALSRNDITESPKDANIVAFAIVELKDLSGNLVTIYDDAEGLNPETQKTCGNDGQVTFYVEPGNYILEINSKVQMISIASVSANGITISDGGTVQDYIDLDKVTTQQLINDGLNYTYTGQVIETSGFSAAGDGGGAKWLLTSNTNTPSRSPLQLNQPDKLTDAGGREWVLAKGSSQFFDGVNYYGFGFGSAGNGEYKLSNGKWLKSIVDSSLFDLDRPPSRKDLHIVGSSGNYRWIHDGKKWIRQRQKSGEFTSWVEDKNNYRPLENKLSDCAGLYFTTKVLPSYAGACMNVTNSTTGVSFDVGFNDDGTLDTDYLENQLLNTEGLVNIWYDQSGNGNDLVSSGSNRPVISKSKLVNGLPAIIFETTSDYNGAATDQFLTIPSSVTGQSDSLSMGVMARFRHTTRDCALIELAGSDGSYTTIGKRNQNGVDGLMLTQNQVKKCISGIQPQIGTNFIVGSVSPTESKLFINGLQETTGTSDAGVSFAGGKIGVSTDTYVNGAGSPINGGAAISGLYIKNSSTSTLEYRAVYFALLKKFNIQPQDCGNLIFDGDSITEGAFGRFYTAYPQTVSERLAVKPKVYNVAIGGGTTDSQNNNRTDWQDKLYNQYAPFNIVVLAIGTNDIGGDKTDVETWNGIVTYVNSVRATGYDVILSTIVARNAFLSNPAREGYRLSVNQMMRDNYISLGCIGIIDYKEEGTMGDTSFASNTTYFEDGTHPTPVGYGLMATYVQSVVEPILLGHLDSYFNR